MTEHQNTPNQDMTVRHVALIPAAGVGARMAAGSPKQYLTIGSKPMLRHTVDAFLSSPLIAHTYVVVSADDPFIDGVLPDASEEGARVTVLRCGGATRMESIRNGLRAVHGTLGQNDWVLVHDAARPGLDAELIERLITETGEHPVGGLLALPVVDTVKRSALDKVSTVPRDSLWLAQTPQMFRYQLLGRALDAATDPSAITDDASAVEALGLAPKLVEGHPRNLKVTLPSDIRIAEMYLAAAARP
ncbi:2-C-methyl-D-erythritol 4-phosphate cytidylyltransferase [Massilia sp. YIM B02443]|uniref:2-C-methyl-D-erythritol 4-phosphate cytidylyltransferase n=1 Tax=Massilia sp. YIM B02443 TaxID=3050127 RepID=UPI0025B6E3A3|nr:2-C-methyl-D-erythritol 4-phosphate cytidylyltransferase [Massilia sp. YIM B02443]MDN4036471.1 2-C-methyl-D-erythritol 4-phosphate cytidylyltransferase [Massilia sp. YIM B02443]